MQIDVRFGAKRMVFWC